MPTAERPVPLYCGTIPGKVVKKDEDAKIICTIVT